MSILADPAPVTLELPALEVPAIMYLGFDWAQAELYKLCLFSKDLALKTALLSGDVHRWVIGMLLEIPLDQVDHNKRELAKILQYALIYSGFNYEQTALNVLRKAHQRGIPTSLEEIKRALAQYAQTFHGVDAFVKQALFDWHGSGGNVHYLLNQRKSIPFADYLKPDEGSLRRDKKGRIAVNTYGQNSVGLLLKMYLSAIRRDPDLHAFTNPSHPPQARYPIAQHIPLFDACTHLIRTQDLQPVLERLHYYATPILRHDGFEIRMKADWKASLYSWGDLRKIEQPQNCPDDAAWIIAWDKPTHHHSVPTPVPAASDFNPFTAPAL